MIKEFESTEWRKFVLSIGIDIGWSAVYHKDKFETALNPYNAKHIICSSKVEFESEIDYLAFKLKYGL